MRKSLGLIAFLASIVLMTAFSAQAAEGVNYVGHGVTRLMSPTQNGLNRSNLLTGIARHDEISEPLGQAKRKDTTSAGISRSAAEPKKNTTEKPSPDRAVMTEKSDVRESKFGIYNAIKESVLDFFLPSRKKTAEKVDISRLQKDGRTERAIPKRQPEVR